MEYMEQSEKINELEYNGQPVKLKSPGMKGFPYFLRITRAMASIEGLDSNPSMMEVMSALDNNSINDLTALMELVIECTFSDVEDKDTLNQWVSENSMQLMQGCLGLFTPPQTREQVKKQEVIQRLQNVKSSVKQE